MKIQLVFPKILSQASVALDQAKKELEQAKKLYAKLMSKTKLICPNCKHPQEIGATTYIQTHWLQDDVYTQNWMPGEGQYRCHHCDKVIRLYDQPEVVVLKDYFYNVHEEYER